MLRVNLRIMVFFLVVVSFLVVVLFLVMVLFLIYMPLRCLQVGVRVGPLSNHRTADCIVTQWARAEQQYTEGRILHALSPMAESR